MGCQMSVKKIIALSLIVTFASAITAGAAENWEQYKDQVRIKKAIAAQLTPEQYQARVEKLAKMLAARANAPKSARPNAPLTSGDTCPSATFEVQALPFNNSSTTVGLVDDYKLPPDTTAPTCTASTTCTGTGAAASLPRGSIYTGTGTGPDRAYRIRTSANCTLSVAMTPTGGQDLGLITYQSQCSNSLADCDCVSDQGVANVTETISMNAIAGTDYFVVVDGYSTSGVAPGPSGPFNLAITGTGCTLTPVELQNFGID